MNAALAAGLPSGIPEVIWLAIEPVDMRRGVEGLSTHLQASLGRSPCDGTAWCWTQWLMVLGDTPNVAATASMVMSSSMVLSRAESAM